MSYSYNVEELTAKTVSRMRFELGDNIFNPAELTAALQDEEYQAVIDQAKTWNDAKIKCIRAILMKYSHQTTMTVGPVTYDFSKRVDAWQKLLKDIENQVSNAVPISVNTIGGKGSKPYFHTDMQKNWRY